MEKSDKPEAKVVDHGDGMIFMEPYMDRCGSCGNPWNAPEVGVFIFEGNAAKCRRCGSRWQVTDIMSLKLRGRHIEAKALVKERYGEK